MKLDAVTLDCPDPLALAAFYRQATGLSPHPESDGEFAALELGAGMIVGFQRVEAYRAPTWPDQTVPQQLHLCFTADEDDLDEAEAKLLGLGAGRADHQPDAARYRVLTDPAGHPFCLVRKRGQR